MSTELPRGLSEPAFDPNAMRVLNERYLAKKADGSVETPVEFLWRVASAIAIPERVYAERAGRDGNAVVESVAHAFYDMLARRDFMPNTPCLVNAGRPLSMLSACFVLPVPDSIEGIFYNLQAMALIQKSGGGCVSADSRVWTTFCGLEPIEVLFNRATSDGRAGERRGNGVAYDVGDLGIRTFAMEPQTGTTALKGVTHVWKFDVPAKDQVVVATREGVEVQTSAWHPFMVLRGTEFVEARADALRAGDIVLGPERPDEQWPWSEYRTLAGLTIDESIGWLIGFTLGGGSFGYVPALRQERLRWFSGTSDVLDRVRAILADHGIHIGMDKDPRGNRLTVTTLEQDFVAAMLAACGFMKRGPKDARIRVPEIIAKSPLAVVRAFLAGLMDSDGCVDADGSPSYTTVSREMAHDLAALMSLLGYAPTLRSKEPHGKGKRRAYTVLLCRLPQVDTLARDIAHFMAGEQRRLRLRSTSVESTALALPFAGWRDILGQHGLVRRRGSKAAGPLADELDRWSCNAAGRIPRTDLQRVADVLAEHDARLGTLLRSLAKRGQEIESVRRAAVAMPYYDLTVAEWNTYASGRTGMAMIHNTGFAFSDLRANGALVASTGKDASGPVSFMKVFNAATDSIKQGGVRRGANMGVLRVDHPDVFHFMRCKKELDAENRALYNRMSDTGRYTDAQLAHIKQELLQTQINNFNISIGVTDAFMAAVEHDADFDLIDPTTHAVVRTVKAREIWDGIVEGAWQNGEPGVLFLDHPEWNPLPGLGPIHATNPCVTGDTLVAVADGRGHVPIAELAAQGDDVPVFCYDDRGKVAVRTMRHPRVTGKGKPVLRITLDDGSVVRATDNHKFRLRDGTYKPAGELAAGDSLKIMTRFAASIKDIFPNANSRSQDYWWINNGKATNRLEHPYIAEHHYATRIPAGGVVHHRDFNAQNNRPDNLAIMSKAEHDALHGRTMIGDANPMRRAKTEWSAARLAAYAQKHRVANSGPGNPRYGGVSNDELRSAALELTATHERRFSSDEWIDYAQAMGLPEQFSGWRMNHLNGGLLGLAKWAALELGFDHVDADPRVVRQLREALSAGYDATIDGDGALLIAKRCEGCSAQFTVAYVYREIAYCSQVCGARTANRRPDVIAKRQTPRRATLDRLAGQLREKQLKVYTELKAQHGIVLKRDWQQRCAQRGISAEISRASSPFRSYAALREAASTFNHRVVAVEFDSYADVYNGTVDDFHNFFVGGFPTPSRNGKAKYVYLNNAQCGEQALHGYDSCNLGSINVGHFFDSSKSDVDWDRLGGAVNLAIRFLDNVIDANLYPVDEIKQMVTANRRVGLGIMGFADLLVQLRIAYGSPEAIALAEKLMKFMQSGAEDTSEILALERGEFPNKHLSKWADDPRPRRNAALLSIAPTGTISMIAGCSFGCEPYFGIAYTKHVMKDAEGRPQHLYYVLPLFEEIAKDEGFFSDALLAKVEQNRGSLRGIPEVPELWQRVFTVAADVTVDQHIDMLAAFQKHTCNAVSKCVAAGTLIPTDKGIIPIEQMGRAREGEFGELNDTYHVVAHDGERRRVTGFYNNGRAATIRIRTNNGSTLEASETHHVLTINGWMSMAELQVGDLIVGRFEELSGRGGEAIETSSYPFRNTATPVTLPTAMSPDLALFLGMLAADGHAVESTGNVGLSEKDESGDVGRTFDALALQLFGQQPRVIVDKRTGVRTRYLTSRALSRYISGLIGEGAANKRVPAQVLRGAFAEKVAFLNGVSLDGHVASDTHRHALVVYGGISRQLADGVEAMCRSLGVPSCYRYMEGRTDGYTVHQVRVTAELQELLDPVETRKKVFSGNSHRLVRLPAQVFSMSLPSAHSEFSNLRSLKERRPQHCLASTLEKLQIPLADEREYLVKVASIEVREAQTYDIEVEESHSYVVNGLVSHNTINAPNDDTRENVARSIFRAYKSGCKGFTYYRDGSRTEQVVTFSNDADISGVNRDAGGGKAENVVIAAEAIVKDVNVGEPLEALLARAKSVLGEK